MGKIKKSKRHKKVKPLNAYCDEEGFSLIFKNNEKINQPPKDLDDQPISKKWQVLMDLKKKVETHTLGEKCSKQKKIPDYKQKPHESEEAHEKRLDIAFKQKLAKARIEDRYNVKVIEDNSGRVSFKKLKSPMSEAQKQRILNMKNRKKLRRLNKQVKDSDDFVKFTDHVKFGEVAIAPPKLIAKPRNIQHFQNEKAAGSKSLLLKKVFQESEGSKQKITRLPGMVIKDKFLSPAEKRNLEHERNRIVHLYREMKKTKVGKNNSKI